MFCALLGQASEKLILPFFLALYSGSQVSIVALWATCLLCHHVTSTTHVTELFTGQ